MVVSIPMYWKMVFAEKPILTSLSIRINDIVKTGNIPYIVVTTTRQIRRKKQVK